MISDSSGDSAFHEPFRQSGHTQAAMATMAKSASAHVISCEVYSDVFDSDGRNVSGTDSTQGHSSGISSTSVSTSSSSPTTGHRDRGEEDLEAAAWYQANMPRLEMCTLPFIIN